MQSEPIRQILLAGWRGGGDDARDRLIARLHSEPAQIAAARRAADWWRSGPTIAA
jgi:hypothetical protein